MRDPDAALARWVSRAPLWLRTLSLRRDLALPLVLLAVQLTGAAVADGTAHLFNPPHPLGALDRVLLAVGPVALVARRRYPVPVLWVCFAATLPLSSSSGWIHISFIVAFFVAATTGKRYSAWLALALDCAWTIWFAPLIYGYAILSANDALLLAGWTVAVVIAAEATRFRAERAAATRASRQIDQRRQQSEERRTMLTTLRRDDDGVAPRSPAPGLGRLPELIELTRAAGLTVDVEAAGTAPPLPAAVHLAAYRIVQESLTNVARHAGRARVTVRVTYDDAEVHVEIDDDGAAPSGGGTAIGTGSGITGMRERAAALGGELSAGFRHGGGFRVSARL